MPRRKVPFSGKAKRQQLKEKRHKPEGEEIQPRRNEPSKSKSERYKLQLGEERQAEIEERKRKAFESITLATENKFVMKETSESYFPEDLSFPRRPSWSYEMDAAVLDARENSYFEEFKQNLIAKFGDQLGYWEQNLETWRQFWRVLEMSDIIFYIVDIRYVTALFSPSLHKYCWNELKKPLIIVLNKIDLIPDEAVLAWMEYFKSKFQGMSVMLFTSSGQRDITLEKKSKKHSKISYEAALTVHKMCQEAIGDKINLLPWKDKIEKEFHSGAESEISGSASSDEYFVTIGCIGQPNAGKSSFINAICNRKVVSVSKTPGHTKHFQTIFVAENVRLCDCPGLVFPSLVPKEIQVLSGCYPVSQLSNPYTTIRFMAERIDLINILKLKHPDDDDSWSAMDVCNAWAIRRGYFTKKGARPDTYRAANAILRMALDGSVTIYGLPDNYESILGSIDENDEKLQTIKNMKYQNHVEENISSEHSEEESSSSEEECIVSNVNKFGVLDSD